MAKAKISDKAKVDYNKGLNIIIRTENNKTVIVNKDKLKTNFKVDVSLHDLITNGYPNATITSMYENL